MSQAPQEPKAAPSSKQALSDLHDTSIEIIGLTRDANSPRSQQLLARHPTLRLISGDYNDPGVIFTASTTTISKIFLVQTPPGFPPNADLEEKQRKALIDAAIAHGVKVFVQTTVDRGPRSDSNPTGVPHFRSKFNIEKHLLRRVEECGGQISYTILRPTVFMENFSGGFMTKLLATSLRDGLPGECPIQLVAARDIGWFGARALVRAEDVRLRNRAISLAGEELSFGEMQRVYEEVCGEAMLMTYSFVNWGVSLLIEGLPKTLRSFREDGFSADVAGLREAHPELMNFRAWLRENVAGKGDRG